ncbi:MAG: neuraminidase, partial [Spirochaetaceae bacterium]|nr:neuraminidase [Spirochaetaceae bacterium]
KPAAGSTRYEVVVPLKSSLPAERTSVAVTADIQNAASLTGEAVIYVVRPKPENEIIASEEFRWTNDILNSEGAVLLNRDVPMFGYYNGRPVAEAVFDTSDPALDISVSGNSIVLTALSDGTWEPGSLRITDIDGHTFDAGPFSFVADSEPPLLTIASPSSGGDWVRSDVLIEGSARDTISVASVEYSLNGGEWLPLAVSSDSAQEVSFSQTVSLEGVDDGLVVLTVRAFDSGGKSAVTSRVLNKDTVSPAVVVIVPAADDSINGETTIAFLVEDAGKLVSAEYLIPGEEDSVEESGIALELGSLITTVIGTAEQPLSQTMAFRFTDAAGNVTVKNTWDFIVDEEVDLPVAEIHLPAEDEVLRSDFVISGIVYDDDGPARIWYSIDDAPFVPLEEYGSSFSIPVPLQSVTDNEHYVTVYAEDIHGVTGHHIRRNFRISLEEPKGQVVTPLFDQIVKGMVSITGVASDKNGIAKVQVSLDNGNTFNDAMGAEEWEYVFDSHVIEDGTHVVFIRIYDNYNTEGLYSSLMNIDNTAPEVSLNLPMDDTRTSGPLFVSGFTSDNISLERVYLRIRNLNLSQPPIPAHIEEIELPLDAIITKSLDLSVLPSGFYNVEVTGEDTGGNLTRISRNIEINKTLEDSRIEFLYPLNGEHVQGMFNVYGRVVSEKPMSTLLLYVDGVDVGITEPSSTGYFKFTVSPELISSGSHNLVIRGLLEGDRIIISDERYLIYSAVGPWLTIDNFVMGDFAIERPWIEGSAGYSFTEADLLAMRSRDTSKFEREQLQAKSIDRIEVSFDNGKTFRSADSGRKWRFRIENQDMAEGYHFLIVRAIMKNGEMAVTRSIVQIDKTIPAIRLISPAEGGRFNDGIIFSGLSSDDVDLKDVKIILRSGDKSSYEIPSFIQGLYLDTHFWGATLYDIGLGLTFFDDNVKLQVQFGQFTSEQRTWIQELLGHDVTNMRYGGNVFGAKLLANLAYIPFSYFLGPDWSWLSASVALGANFSLFTETQSGKPQMLSAVLAQIEFPRVTIPRQKMFRTFSFYTEVQLWFIPTDVDSANAEITSLLPHISGGIRINVF